MYHVASEEPKELRRSCILLPGWAAEQLGKCPSGFFRQFAHAIILCIFACMGSIGLRTRSSAVSGGGSEDLGEQMSQMPESL